MEPTHETELTEPVDLCTPDGSTLSPAATGWSRRPLHRANLRGRRFRTKKWDYWAVLAGDVVMSVVYADVGYLGLGSVWWGDLRSGETGGAEVARPLARGFSLPDVPGSAPLVLRSARLRIDIRDHTDHTRLVADWTERDGRAGALDVTVERPIGHESLGVVIPWSERTFQFTNKDQARPARGVLRVGPTVHEVGGDAWGVLDVGRGRWPYATQWNWGGGAGRARTGEVVGVQLGGIWTVGTGATENAVCVDGRLHKIGRELEWRYDWDDPMRPWRVRDRQDAVDLTLTPRLDKHSRTDAVLLRTEVHQVFGTWSGTVRAEDGTELQLDSIQGFAEESRSRW